MNKEVRPFEEYKEMIQNMSKDNMIKGLYDLSANIIEKDKENERLNNIIDELEKWLEERKTYYCRGCSHIYEDSLGKTRLVNEDIFDEITVIKNKLKELKGE